MESHPLSLVLLLRQNRGYSQDQPWQQEHPLTCLRTCIYALFTLGRTDTAMSQGRLDRASHPWAACELVLLGEYPPFLVQRAQKPQNKLH